MPQSASPASSSPFNSSALKLSASSSSPPLSSSKTTTLPLAVHRLTFPSAAPSHSSTTSDAQGSQPVAAVISPFPLHWPPSCPSWMSLWPFAWSCRWRCVRSVRLLRVRWPKSRPTTAGSLCCRCRSCDPSCCSETLGSYWLLIAPLSSVHIASSW